MRKRTYDTNVAFLDLLFNTLLCFAALFTLSFVMINPSRQNANMESKAEFLIIVTWPHQQDNDVDVYIEDPEGHLVSFSRREDGLMHLDVTTWDIETILSRHQTALSRIMKTERLFLFGVYFPVNI